MAYRTNSTHSPYDMIELNALDTYESSSSNLALNDTHEDEISTLVAFSKRYAPLHGYISVFVCVFGIIANVANIVVLTRKNMITTTNIVLTWLAVTDSMKMLDYLPFVTYFYILKEDDLAYFASRSYSWMCFLLYHASFSIVCHTVAIWCTIVLAIMRFLIIWFPAKGSMWCSHRRAKISIAVVYVSVIIICIPNFMMNTMTTIHRNVTDAQGKMYTEIIYHSSVRTTGEFSVVSDINFYIQALLVKLVPCVTLTIFTVLLIYAMHKAYKKRIALKSQGKKEDADRHHEHNRTTGMLLAVVVLFLITELPQGMLTLLIIFIPSIQHSVYNPLGDILDIVALCNNAINFVLYCSMSTLFRDTFVRIFCTCCPKNRPGWSKTKLITNGNGRKYNSTHDGTTTTDV
ncbi:sex peptide receptor-like [Mizuhopecten yessoensis]|uniref:G-protein coupled receptor B0563.6 n=1 Tax=Mizuhopecten yessoensis TaxID=6573 RepID=A0A210Q0W7_MIZYE|nr:sex peptide receptor-like [Mizuhopecten yessoensis]XP_021370143.1 sex peptide receptor-like [Mizuhopecten yessoensis]XP_021370144.1 sex peptide receptor-like [Mizuhopecten yessoensis]XP_021370145.1 sex peptide receptor-like [Mizuhopecten yessoensis]OWF42390.1 G-protein coupled receptor B0563.6 [Mizuhopecten yessoensis]